jgi:hypothetical protein
MTGQVQIYDYIRQISRTLKHGKVQNNKILASAQYLILPTDNAFGIKAKLSVITKIKKR